MSNNSGLPSNLYSGGNVNFNSSPYTQYYLNTQLRNRAKEEALTKSILDVMHSVQTDGMRPQDVNEGGFANRVDEWKNYGRDNLKDIVNPQNDKYEKYSKFMDMHQRLLNEATASKAAKENRKGILPILTNQANRELLTKDAIKAIDANNLPLTKGYQPIDYDSHLFNPKPYSSEDMRKDQMVLKGIQGIHSNKILKEEVDPNNKSRNIVTYGVGFIPEQLNAIKSLGQNRYYSHSGFQNLVDQEAQHPDNPNYQNYNELYNRYYGKNIEQPEEMATAHMLALHPETTYQRFIPNGYKAPSVGRGASGGKPTATDRALNWVNETGQAFANNDTENAAKSINALGLSGKVNGVNFGGAKPLPNGNVEVSYEVYNKDLQGFEKKQLEINPQDPNLNENLKHLAQVFTGANRNLAFSKVPPNAPKKVKTNFKLPSGFKP